jgi:hypothetical protein
MINAVKVAFFDGNHRQSSAVIADNKVYAFTVLKTLNLTSINMFYNMNQ